LQISGGSLGFAKCDDDVLDDLKRAFNSFFRTSSARREKMGSLRKDEVGKMCIVGPLRSPSHLVGRDGSFVA
jgi:hypothetical protein